MDGLFSRFTSAPVASKPPPLFFNAFLQSVKVVLPDGMLASSSVAASVFSSFLFAMMIFVFIFWPKSAKRLPRKFLVPASASNETERKWRPKPRFVKPKKFSKESKEFGEEYAGDFSSNRRWPERDPGGGEGDEGESETKRERSD
jgi:hypothetical protein